MDLRIGTSGWTYASWRGRLYPQDLPYGAGSRTTPSSSTASRSTGSFYRLPEEATFRKWGETVPEGFRFAVKGSRYVTHFKRLRDVEESVALVVDRARALGERLGPVLWQLRPDTAVDLPRLDGFLAVLPPDVRHVLETRHPSWSDRRRRVRRCTEAGVALASWEMLGEERDLTPTAPFVYVRFHGSTARYGGRYPEAVLEAWVSRIRAWRDDGREIWAFFNNDIDGHAVEDARRLRDLVGRSGGSARSTAGTRHETGVLVGGTALIASPEAPMIWLSWTIAAQADECAGTDAPSPAWIDPRVDGAVDVPLDARIPLRLPHPATATLETEDGVEVRTSMVNGGLGPRQLLEPETRYRLTVVDVPRRSTRRSRPGPTWPGSRTRSSPASTWVRSLRTAGPRSAARRRTSNRCPRR